MIKKYYYTPNNRTEWLKLRNKFSNEGKFGGTDSATILNANSWKSALELFYQAVRFTHQSVMVNDKMTFGSVLEEKIALMYQYWDEETDKVSDNFEAGLKVNSFRRVNAVITNDKYPYLFGNIDGVDPDIDAVIEIKNIGKFVIDIYSEPTSLLDLANCPLFVPPAYYIQIQQYLMLLEKNKGRFVFLIDGSKLKVVDIKKDKHLQSIIAEKSMDFGTRVEAGKKVMTKYSDEATRIHLLSAIEPTITDQDCYNNFRTQQLQKLEDYRKDHTMLGTDEQFQLALDYTEQSGIIKDAKSLQNLAGNALKTEFFKHGMETLDFDVNGKIGFKKRLSVKVKANN